MSYDLDHWDNPRGSIANLYVHNDFAYVSRGANIALYILDKFNISPSQAKTMTVLDFGCGTGRAAAFLALMFKSVIGYDPNVNCIRVAKEENIKSDLKLHNLTLISDPAQIPTCDIAFSTNVIEHLTHREQEIMLDLLKKHVTGKSLLWYNPKLNGILKPYLLDSDWEQRLNGGKIQVDFFDIH